MNIEERLKEYRPSEPVKALRVEFELVTPVVLAHPWLHFDALIAHLVLREVLGEEMYLLPTKKPIDFRGDTRLRLPLGIRRREREWVWSASVSFVERDGELLLPSDFYGLKIYKRFETERLKMLGAKQKKIYRGSGKYRDYMMTLPYISTEKMIFFCRGQKKEIARLLRHLPGLGKKVAIGFGEIRKVRILEIDRDESVVLRDGRAARPIPVEMCEKVEDRAWLAYRPPYWAKRNVKLCAVPGSRVEVHKGWR